LTEKNLLQDDIEIVAALIHTHILDDRRVIEALQKLNFAHHILGFLIVHSIQAYSLDRDRLPRRVVESLVYRSELTFANTLAQRLKSAYTPK